MKIKEEKMLLGLFLTAISLLFLPKCSFAMHISEGILPIKWAGLWYLIALPFIIKGILEINKKAKKSLFFKPLLGLIAAMVFIISCMPVPVPTAGTCSHPCGVGIAAILLGPIISVFISSIALLIQALFLAHGGLTTWGANIVSMGVAGSFAGYFAFWGLRKLKTPLFFCGFMAGLMANWATYTLTSLELSLALPGHKSFFSLFSTILIAFSPTQIPLGIFEGSLTGAVMVFVAKRRPDILTSLGVIKEKKVTSLAKGWALFLLLLSLSLGLPALAEEKAKYSGVDETVVEQIAQEHGRSAWTPFINTDQGDVLLFVFLCAGAIGGFILGINYQKLFGRKNNDS